MGGRTLDQFRSLQQAKRTKPKEPTGTTPKRDTDADKNRKKT